jgi:uncharacterized protein
MDRAEPARLSVEVVASPAPREVRSVVLSLPAGSTLADALRASGLATEGLTCGIWGRPCTPDTRLADGDRVECWRALLIDPKEARRQRAGKEKRPARAGRSV